MKPQAWQSPLEGAQLETSLSNQRKSQLLKSMLLHLLTFKGNTFSLQKTSQIQTRIRRK